MAFSSFVALLTSLNWSIGGEHSVKVAQCLTRPKPDFQWCFFLLEANHKLHEKKKCLNLKNIKIRRQKEISASRDTSLDFSCANIKENLRVSILQMSVIGRGGKSFNYVSLQDIKQTFSMKPLIIKLRKVSLSAMRWTKKSFRDVNLFNSFSFH